MTSFTIPEHFLSECSRELCYRVHETTVKQAPSGKWFITMGHPGFNSPANNRSGYATRQAAEASVRRYGRR